MLPISRLLLGLAAVSGLCLTGCASRPQNTATESSRASGAHSAHPKGNSGSSRSAEALAAAHAHYAAAVIHDLNDEPEAALEELYQAALKDADNESLTLQVAQRFLQSKKPDQAIAILSKSAARPNSSAAISMQLGFVYSQQSKLPQAASAFRAAIKKSPRALPAYQNLAVVLVQSKQPKEAVKVLDEAARQSGLDAERMIGLGEFYHIVGRQAPAVRKETNDKALALLNRVETSQLNSPQLILKLADDFSALGETTKAAELYQELLKKLPDTPAVRQGLRRKLTDIYLRNSDHAAAIEQIKAILRDDPTNAQMYDALGAIYFEDRKLEEAADNFSRAILLNPELEQPYYELANAQISLNKTSDALATLAKARTRFPQSFLLEYLTATALSQQKSYAEALKHYTTAEVIASATHKEWLDKFFYFHLGAASERTGDFAAAEKDFQRSLDEDPNFAEALNYLGYMWADRSENLQKARELIEKAVKLEPKNAAYLDSLAWVLYRLNQPEQAVDFALQAVACSEEPDPTVYEHLGDIYSALNQREKAREAWRKSLSLESNDTVRKKLGTEGEAEH